MLSRLWDESWGEGIWIAAWSKAVESLTPAQAAWRPAPNRRCIWETVSHVCIWRESTLARLDGRKGPTREELERDNFWMPDVPDATSWKKSLGRLRESHDEIRKAIADPNSSMERPAYHLGHDCYHLGQIMYLRALQGLPPIE